MRTRNRFLAPIAAGTAVCAVAAVAVHATKPLAPAQASTTISEEEGPSFAGTADEDEVIPGEIAVDLRDDVSDSDVADIDAKYGLNLRANTAWSKTHDKLEVADVDPAAEGRLVDALSHDPRVEHAEPMALYRASFVPDDPLYAKQWHLTR